MKRICIGIHVHTGAQWLQATLASLHANTPQTVELLLLPDGSDEFMQIALENLRQLPQWGTEERLGTAACFNRLVNATDAEILVLLESGSLVGQNWLKYLLAALNADPSHGLAGPSTNRARNEQCVFSRAGCHTFDEVGRTAAEAQERFGNTWRILKPLHSLADFCYVVRREVVEAIGAADEGYGVGGFWEMDYNTRAAQAGFREVWACGAYVHRGPSLEVDRRLELQRLEASKRRYQNKFCRLQLCDRQMGDEALCQGEECEHFALAESIQIQLPLNRVQPPVIPSRIVSVTPTLPLVSCIMPTCDRADYVLQSIHYFQRQDYPACELIVVYDKAEDLPEQLPDDSRIRYMRVAPGQSIGKKRNQACELAQGSIIAHWDDDDWYAPNRLRLQVAPLLSNVADISGLTGTIFFDLARWEFWRCTPSLHKRLFVEDVHGGTLVYKRQIWEQVVRYPDASLREDVTLMCHAIHQGARLCRIPNDDLFIYLRHGGNSWSFRLGQYLEQQGWQRIDEPRFLEVARSFYAARSPAAPIVGSCTCLEQSEYSQPLVSCIMPTANRRVFVPQAIQYFLRQEYLNRELIIVDDGSDSVADLIPSHRQIRYLRLEGKHTIGAKRNFACKEARGEIIVHWDDDDWMAPGWLSYLVTNLLREEADICGLDRILFYDLQNEQAWEYVYPKGGKVWVYGGTLCYKKGFWQEHPFLEIDVGEDNQFVWRSPSNKVVALENNQYYVALIHPGNTSPKRIADKLWHSYQRALIVNLLRKDLAFYTELYKSEFKKEKTTRYL